MKSLTEKIKAYIPKISESLLQEQATSIEFIRSKKVIRRELQFCRDEGNVVGVYASTLGNGMFLLGVEDILNLGTQEVIVFHPHDMSGSRVKKRTMFLDEIQMIVPFNNRYVRPLLNATADNATIAA